MSDRFERVQKEAMAFMVATGKLLRPKKGTIADYLEGKPEKGLNIAVRAIAETIGAYEDVAQQGSNKDFLARMRQAAESNPRDAAGHDIVDPFAPLDLLMKVALPGEEGVKQEDVLALQKGFTHNGRSIFDELQRILYDIGINVGHQVKGETKDMLLDGDEKPRKSEGPRLGWQASLDKGDTKPIDDEKIRESAENDDGNKLPSSDDIKKSAADGPGEFTPDASEQSEYERSEDSLEKDASYISSLRGGHKEMGEYYALCQKLKQHFDLTLGTCLEIGGRAAAR